MVMAGPKNTKRNGTREKKLLMETRSWAKNGIKNKTPTIAKKTVITKYATGELK